MSTHTKTAGIALLALACLQIGVASAGARGTAGADAAQAAKSRRALERNLGVRIDHAGTENPADRMHQRIEQRRSHSLRSYHHRDLDDNAEWLDQQVERRRRSSD